MMSKQKSTINKTIKSYYQLILICLTVAFLVLSILGVMEAFRKAASNAANSFTDSTTTTAKNVHDSIYEEFYKIAERNHHVSNRGSLTIGNLKKESKLEVYKVVDNELVVENKNDNNYGLTQWVKVTGIGTFTVDLGLSEFIIDDENEVITVRIPNLELDTPQIKMDKIFNADDFALTDINLFDNKTQAGSKLSDKQKQEGLDMVIKEFTNNPQYYADATEATKKILTSLIKGLNPDNENLKVIVEIID